MIVCLCAGVSDRDVRAAIDGGANCMSSLRERGIGAGCGSCHPDLRKMLRAAGAEESALWCHLEEAETAQPVAIA
ncbi:MAG TPA: (2Fe-2S)-binding protein [Thermoanaerobaculia bacterium]